MPGFEDGAYRNRHEAMAFAIDAAQKLSSDRANALMSACSTTTAACVRRGGTIGNVTCAGIRVRLMVEQLEMRRGRSCPSPHYDWKRLRNSPTGARS
jgi:hypothetical protein